MVIMLSTMNVSAETVATTLREDPAFAMCVFHEAAMRQVSFTAEDFAGQLAEAMDRMANPEIIVAWLRDVANTVERAAPLADAITAKS